MAGFLYFKPGHVRAQASVEQLQEWGLGHVSDTPLDCREVTHQQAKVLGSVMGTDARMEGLNVGYYPDKQEWRKIPGSDCWVGYFKAKPPRPEDLARTKVLNGYQLELNDGNTWVVPSVVHVVEGLPTNMLPCDLDMDDDGNPCKGTPLPQYQHLWQLAQPYIKAFMIPQDEDSDKADDLESRDVLHFAITLMQTNYFIGAGEILLRKLFTEDCFNLPLQVNLFSIDYPTWIKWSADLAKKKSPPESDGSNTFAGNGASPQATTQPQLT